MKAEQTDGANPRPFGTSVMLPADPAARAGSTPEASGDSSSGTFAYMKALALLLAASTYITSASASSEEKLPIDTIEVAVLAEALPSEEWKRQTFLADIFPKIPEERRRFSHPTEKWNEIFPIFAAALTNEAQKQKLNSQSLEKALVLVFKHAEDKIAYLPVGAYQTTLNGKLIWIVAVEWERPPRRNPSESYGLGHMRAFAFEQDTLNQVGFMTCL